MRGLGQSNSVCIMKGGVSSVAMASHSARSALAWTVVPSTAALGSCSCSHARGLGLGGGSCCGLSGGVGSS